MPHPQSKVSEVRLQNMLKALIFDFDGLILDTEGPVYQSWLELFQSYGCDLPFSTWSVLIGTMDVPYEPFDLLEEQVGHPLDRAALERERWAREDALIADQQLMPGVTDYLSNAIRLDLKLAVASSSSYEWVNGHLSQRRLISYFECIRSSDHVERTKPDPALYLSALSCLGVEAREAIAFEDSPNGILAAKRAGLFCVAVPNQLTSRLPLGEADLEISSLADLPLKELLDIFHGNGR